MDIAGLKFSVKFAVNSSHQPNDLTENSSSPILSSRSKMCPPEETNV